MFWNGANGLKKPMHQGECVICISPCFTCHIGSPTFQCIESESPFLIKDWPGVAFIIVVKQKAAWSVNSVTAILGHKENRNISKPCLGFMFVFRGAVEIGFHSGLHRQIWANSTRSVAHLVLLDSV